MYLASGAKGRGFESRSAHQIIDSGSEKLSPYFFCLKSNISNSISNKKDNKKASLIWRGFYIQWIP